MTMRQTITEWVMITAEHLGPIVDEVVFVGGAAAGLLITDPAAPDIRPTDDIDLVAEITSRIDYYKLEQLLRDLGFKHKISEEAPICRWTVGGVIVDVMPSGGDVLGFSNRWYPEAIRTAIPLTLRDNLTIKLISAPCFIATKLEAFKDRGKGDYLMSHDMADIIALIDGRAGVIAEIEATELELKDYLRDSFKGLMADSSFHDALPGHLLPDAASQARISLLRERINSIAR